MLKAQAVLEVADRGFDLAVAAVVGLQLQGEASRSVMNRWSSKITSNASCEPGSGAPGARSAAPQGRAAEWAVAGLGHRCPALQPGADRRPGVVGDLLDRLADPLLHLAVIEERTQPAGRP